MAKSKSLGKSLIIVESPAKIKTLKKFLGSQYLIESSVGHIRDLPEREFGIDIENDFEPKYITMPDKKEVISKLKRAAKECDIVYLSPDPDREGEAIAWHIKAILPEGTVTRRVSFNSLTKDTVLKALEIPRDIDLALVNAQQARRLLDRIVGYKISPILNRRIQRGKEGFVSAGRVQSVALKLVVDREKAIEAFVPVEYWNLGAILKTHEDEKNFKAYLYSVDGKKVEKEPIEGKDLYIINNKETADEVLERLRQEQYEIIEVEKKEKRRNAPPPFITSTLQQEASRHYGFSSSRTMKIAQGLYEGVDIGAEGAEGLITYMRTDSVRIAPEIIAEARTWIASKYGQDFLPAQPKEYATGKSAQDAHEAIRPSTLHHTPDSIEQYLTRDQFLLYQLIWRRFFASQMNPVIYDTVSADISAGPSVVLRATGSVMKFQGYLAVYEEKEDDVEKDEDGRLPPLEAGQPLSLLDLTSEQAFTRPPPRFTEASLVKELEKSGIGRPSTYAAIMNKIQSRDYTTKESGRLKPTELGRVIAQMLETSFQQIMNIGFTAEMENSLELVAENQKDWKQLLREFWKDFYPTIQTAEKEAFVPKIMTDIDCPKCGQAKLQKIWSKSKYFFGCSRYPDCDYSAPLEEVMFNKEDYHAEFNWEQLCPKCGSPMKVRHGRYGTFLGCTKYPECKGIINIPKKGEVVIAHENLPECPAIGCDGRMVARKSRFGKTFYSCTNYPDCDVIANTPEQLEEKYVNHPKTPYVKKEKKGFGRKGAAAKKTPAKKEKKEKKPAKARKPGAVLKLSPALAEIVGSAEMARTEVTKKVWEYIKAHELQDKKNKRLIHPDKKMAKIFETNDPVDMFKMTALLNKHINI